MKWQKSKYRIGCVSTRSGLLRALGYYAQHNCYILWHLLRALGYYAQIAVIHEFIKLKFSIFKILSKILFSI